MAILTPNMSLVQPTIGVDNGIFWEESVNLNTQIIDGHNHSPGSGTFVNSDGININSDLLFNDLNAIDVRSVRFHPQLVPLAEPTDLGSIYVSGVDLYYNDLNGVQIPITADGQINATAEGIADGTASASFSLSILTVISAPGTPASIKAGSYIMGNTGLNPSNYLTLQPLNPLPASYSLTLPAVSPVGIQLLQIDTVGNISPTVTFSAAVANNIGTAMTSIGANAIAASMTNTGADAILNTADAAGANALLAKTTSVALIGGKHPAVANSGTQRIGIVRGSIVGNVIAAGQGFTLVHIGAGNYEITFSISFADRPSVIATPQGNANAVLNVAKVQTISNTVVNIYTLVGGTGLTDSNFDFIAMGTPT